MAAGPGVDEHSPAGGCGCHDLAAIERAIAIYAAERVKEGVDIRYMAVAVVSRGSLNLHPPAAVLVEHQFYEIGIVRPAERPAVAVVESRPYPGKIALQVQEGRGESGIQAPLGVYPIRLRIPIRYVRHLQAVAVQPDTIAGSGLVGLVAIHRATPDLSAKQTIQTVLAG